MVDNTFRTAYVYIRNEFAGILCETDEGYTFSYDEEYLDRENASAVSLTMPLSKDMYRSKTLFSLMDSSPRAGCLMWSVEIGK